MNSDGVYQIYAKPNNPYTSKWLRLLVVAEFCTKDGKPTKENEKFNHNTAKKYQKITMFKGKPLIKMWCNPNLGVCETIFFKVKKYYKLVAK